ncbi:MAG TPA: nitroreductase family deazaflavin-dependent oxidoreductase [Acidimicrobiales bacterium]|jgi:deazaflavin-dependent oxidoreductase (nitroreductase family)
MGVLDLVGIPSIQLLIPGRRSGIVRATTLQCVEFGDGYLVVGSNWGHPSHPAWSANLQAVKNVRARHRDQEFQADVRELVGSERSQAWASILRAWPNYELAQQMSSGRPFRIFALARARDHTEDRG